MALPAAAKLAVVVTMSTKSRQVIYGGRIMGADIRAQDAREAAKQAIREADRAEAEAGRLGWRGMGDRRSLRLRSVSASTAALPGSKSNATAVRPSQPSPRRHSQAA